METKTYDLRALLALLLVSRLFVSFAFLGERFQNLKTGDNAAAWFFFAGFLFLSLLPVLFYLKKNEKTSILTAAQNNPRWGRWVGLFYGFYFLLTALGTLLRFDLFCDTVMLPSLPTLLFSALLLAAACYGARCGLGTLLRAGEAAAALLLPVIVAVAVLLLGQAESKNITPLFYDGLAAPLSLGQYSAGLTAELAALPVLSDRLRGKKTAPLLCWAGGLSALVLVMILLTAAVLGQYGNGQPFPLYTVTVLAQAGPFRRADALQSGVWTLAVLVKLGFFLYLAALSFGKALSLPAEKSRRLPLLLAPLLLTAVWLLTREEQTALAFFDRPVFALCFLLGVVALPVLVPLLPKIKERGRVHG